jgi:catechol 2,3-dioxygenase-like lactoylglutathione lyase family enzyme
VLIKEINILTADIENTRQFYSQVLGLPVISVANKQLQLSAGNSILTFLHTHNKDAKYHFAFNIPANKTNEALNWLTGRAEPIKIDNKSPIADFRNWNATSVYFYDNNGNVLEFIARRDLHNETSQSFNSNRILSISEIGIVTDHVSLKCESLIREFRLDYFEKQPPLENFAALGDDNGLLIIVSNTRNWYPTNVPSLPYWHRVIFSIDNKEHVLQYT